MLETAEPPTADRLQQLLDRVRVLEDTLAIQHLITTYGPAVDAGSAETVASLWTHDGIYDVDTAIMRGRDAIMAMVRSDAHQTWINGGCGHLLDPLNIRVDGDSAVVTCHSQLIVNGDSDGFRVQRVTANRWELVKLDGQWKVKARIARVLDGRAESRELLAAGVQ